MQDPADYDLHRADPVAPASTPRARATWPWVVGIAAMAAVVLTAFLVMWNTGPAPQTTATPAAAAPSADTAPAESVEPLGAATDPIVLPPLGETDHVVRPMVSALSFHPAIARLLTTDGLIRRFAVSIENLATGQSPAGHLAAIRPGGPYPFIDQEDVVLVDPAGYARYDGMADAFASVDAVRAARLYTNLKPRVEEAYRELGRLEPFDRAFERAIVSLLQVPVPSGDIRLLSKGALFLYADPALEGLTPAQKQLFRMGPRNVRIVQAQLRELAVALGIPQGRLPA